MTRKLDRSSPITLASLSPRVWESVRTPFTFQFNHLFKNVTTKSCSVTVNIFHLHHHSFLLVLLSLVFRHSFGGRCFRRWFDFSPFLNDNVFRFVLLVWEILFDAVLRLFQCRFLLHLSLIFFGASVLTFLTLKSQFSFKLVYICKFQGLICLYCVKGF